MQLRTISQVSKGFGISTRTLRYWEQIGLVKSRKMDDYAYRTYDAEAIRHIRQIIVLRKLRIPLKQIALMLQNGESKVALDVFAQSLEELNTQMAALATIRSILRSLVASLENTAQVQPKLNFLSDDAIEKLLDSLALSKIPLKEESVMEELNQANRSLSQCTDVRIIYLPPSWVAAAHVVGDEPEEATSTEILQFITSTNLGKQKPNVRMYGFNHPNPVDETGFHGYEAWVTIPEAMEVPGPLVKKQFAGGLYAAHMIAMGNFQEWDGLMAWVENHDRYEFAGDMGDAEHMFGLMEEHLNFRNHALQGNLSPEGMQLDLLVPVRKKENG